MEMTELAQLLCSVLCEVNIIHINGFVIGIIGTDRFIRAAVSRTVTVQVVSAYLLKLQDFRSLQYSHKIHFPSGFWNTSCSLARLFLCIFLHESVCRYLSWSRTKSTLLCHFLQYQKVTFVLFLKSLKFIISACFPAKNVSSPRGLPKPISIFYRAVCLEASVSVTR